MDLLCLSDGGEGASDRPAAAAASARVDARALLRRGLWCPIRGDGAVRLASDLAALAARDLETGSDGDVRLPLEVDLAEGSDSGDGAGRWRPAALRRRARLRAW